MHSIFLNEVFLTLNLKHCSQHAGKSFCALLVVLYHKWPPGFVSNALFIYNVVCMLPSILLLEVLIHDWHCFAGPMSRQSLWCFDCCARLSHLLIVLVCRFFFFLKKWISCLTFIVRRNVDAWAHSAQRSYANKWTSISGSLWGMTNTSPVSRHVPDAVRYITRQLCYPHFTTPASSHDEGMLGIHQGSMMQRANGGIECSVFVSM